MSKIDKLLEASGAVLVRDKNHEVFKLPNGNKFVRAKTPSDLRAEHNQVADLKKAAGIQRVKPAPKEEGADSATKSTPSSAAVRVEIKTIGPAAAREWLARNVNPRKLSESRAIALSNQILKGKWQLNGESIKFDPEGHLIDGQHRLRAVVLAGVPIQSLVVYGVLGDNVDTGRSRNLTQLFQQHGIADPGRAAGMVTNLYNYRCYRDFNPTGSQPYVSRSEALEIIDREPQIADAIRATRSTSRLFNRHELHATLFYLFAQKAGWEFAEEFYGRLVDGTGLKDTDVIYHLREKLIRTRQEGLRWPRNTAAGIVIKAWNLWLDGRPVKQFRYNYQQEGVPEIKGQSQ